MAKVFLLAAVLYFSHSIFADEPDPACLSHGTGTCLEQLRALENDKANKCPDSAPNPTPKSISECKTASKKILDTCKQAREYAAGAELQEHNAANSDTARRDLKGSARIGKDGATRVSEAYKLAKSICDQCSSKTCSKSCEPSTACRNVNGIALVGTDLAQCTTNEADPQEVQCKKDVEDIATKLKSTSDAMDEAVAKFSESEGGATDTDPGAKATETADDGGGGGGGGQPQAQPQQSPQSTAEDDTQEETKKDDKAAGSGGGMGDMLGGLSEMLNQEPKEKEPCSKATDAYARTDCQSEMNFESVCSNPANAKTDMCASFTSHYCFKGGSAKVGEGYSPAGSGDKSEYCKNPILDKFCVGERNSKCVGCIKRQSASCTGPNCVADASCQLAQAHADVCSGDPYLLSTTYVATCVSAGLKTGAVGGSSVSGASVASSGGGGMSSLGAASVGGTAATVEDYEGSREGLNMGVDSAGGYSQSAGGDDGSGGGDSGVMVNGKRVAKGVAGSRGLATASAIPGDVAGVTAPNLSNIVSEVIKIRCSQFKHHHCEPR